MASNCGPVSHFVRLLIENDHGAITAAPYASRTVLAEERGNYSKVSWCSGPEKIFQRFLIFLFFFSGFPRRPTRMKIDKTWWKFLGNPWATAFQCFLSIPRQFVFEEAMQAAARANSIVIYRNQTWGQVIVLADTQNARRVSDLIELKASRW